VGANHQPPVAPSPASCAAIATWTADCAFVPAALARGGNRIDEVPCSAAGTTPDGDGCAFPGYAGVVGWKSGFRAYRDAPVNRALGSSACALDEPGCDPRMPRSYKDIFRYALFAHALGYPSASDPLAPRRTSGVADANGGDLLVTLGLWDNQTGTEFVQAATLMHEIGHTIGLRHGGIVPSGLLEANCKPNYQSVMNYLFQVRGLLDSKGVPALDFSRQMLPTLGENNLGEAAGLGASTDYLARWYAPQVSSFIEAGLGTTPATRRCDGSLLGPNDRPYVRVDGDPRTGQSVDWNGDGAISGVARHDVNFDGEIAQSFTGANDYATMDLRQVGARRAVGSRELSYSVIDPLTGQAPLPPAPAIGGGLSLDSGYGDLGYGDLGYGDLGYGDLGYGDLGYGDLGYGDLGYGDLGYGDLGAPADDPLALGEGDLNLDTAGSLGNAPNALVAKVLTTFPQAESSRAAASQRARDSVVVGGIQLKWQAPHLGSVISYEVYRVVGTAVNEANFDQRALVAIVPGRHRSLVDESDDLTPNVSYTYFVLAVLPPPPDCEPGQDCSGNVRSGVSNFATVTY
jgi:hypothetical protein